MKRPKVMRRVTAALGLALLLLLPPALGGSEGAETLAITAGTCFYHFAMRLAVGALVPRVLKPNAALFPAALLGAGAIQGPESQALEKPDAHL